MILTQAQVQALDAIRLAHPQGLLVPDAIVTAAEAPDSPLHDLLEWDDDKAGHLYRIGQAQGICRHAMLYAPNGVRTEQRAHVSLWCDRQLPGGGYRSTIEVSASSALRAAAVETAKREMIAALNRYLYILGLAAMDDKAGRAYLLTLMQPPTPEPPRTKKRPPALSAA
jgi:hypothetical protein